MEIFGRGNTWIDTEEIFENLTAQILNAENNDTYGRNISELLREIYLIPKGGVLKVTIIVPLYVIIFFLSIIGNSLVLITLGKRNKMRYNVTNVYLINLAISDILLGVFCMPFTLIGQVFRNFIFGRITCSLIPYLQAVSVSVGIWTLVAISLERYFAICRPLESRRWQTPSHAYKMIGFVWVTSSMWTFPILVVSQLIPLSGGRQKCREEWPNKASEKAYNIFLDIILLLVPLTIMGLAYSLIVGKLWRGLQNELQLSRAVECSGAFHGVLFDSSGDPERQGGPVRRSTLRTWLSKIGLVARDESASSSEAALPVLGSSPRPGDGHQEGAAPRMAHRYEYAGQAIRSNYMEKSIEAKRKVICMLFVVVAEFFICWAPLHVLNTWFLFAPDDVYKYIGTNGISLIQLLAYISSCCNPITYCFMNKRFRQSFFSVFTCCQPCAKCCGVEEVVQRPQTVRVPTASDMSGNESTTAASRAAARNRSEEIEMEEMEAMEAMEAMEDIEDIEAIEAIEAEDLV